LEQEIFDSDDLRSMNLIFDEKTKKFRAEQFHLTLFRLKDCDINFRELFEKYDQYQFGKVPLR